MTAKSTFLCLSVGCNRLQIYSSMKKIKTIFASNKEDTRRNVTLGHALKPLNNEERSVIIEEWPLMMKRSPDIFKSAWIRSAQTSSSIKVSNAH
ncbi:hypothetical protein AB6A40_010822 [Gnathostoma spinigerum]|uniref:Uncharacterized protein n=1 Tax=Gnathostoma spinigerum TaxID=75299 RepID=A0ABD6EVZ7_9BILA